jgi:hypothetical protein
MHLGRSSSSAWCHCFALFAKMAVYCPKLDSHVQEGAVQARDVGAEYIKAGAATAAEQAVVAKDVTVEKASQVCHATLVMAD